MEKDRQLYDLKNIKAAKSSYNQVTEENKQLKQYKTATKQKQQQLNSNNDKDGNAIKDQKKNIKRSFMKKQQIVSLMEMNKKHPW